VIQSIAHFLVHYFDFGGKRLILGMVDFSCPPLPPLQHVGSRARQEHFSTMGSRVHSTSQLWMAANWQKRESLLVAESHCRIA